MFNRPRPPKNLKLDIANGNKDAVMDKSKKLTIDIANDDKDTFTNRLKKLTIDIPNTVSNDPLPKTIETAIQDPEYLKSDLNETIRQFMILDIYNTYGHGVKRIFSKEQLTPSEKATAYLFDSKNNWQFISSPIDNGRLFEFSRTEQHENGYFIRFADKTKKPILFYVDGNDIYVTSEEAVALIKQFINDFSSETTKLHFDANRVQHKSIAEINQHIAIPNIISDENAASRTDLLDKRDSIQLGFKLSRSA